MSWRSAWRVEESPTELTPLFTLVSSAKDEAVVADDNTLEMFLIWTYRAQYCSLRDARQDRGERRDSSIHSHSLLSCIWIKE